MTGELETTGRPAVAPTIGRALPSQLVERMEDYVRHGKADNTWRAYRSDLSHFGAWCETEGLEALPAAAATVAAYLSAHAATLAVSTLRRRLAAISVAHQAAGYKEPADQGARGQSSVVGHPPRTWCRAQEGTGRPHKGHQRSRRAAR